MKKVIVFGSLNMDLSIHCAALPSQGETVQGDGFCRAAGGKGANQAVAAAKLGAQTYMLGMIGNDSFGDGLQQALSDAGVHSEHLLIGTQASGVAVVLRSEGDNRIICDYGSNYEVVAEDIAPLMTSLAQPEDLFLAQLECQPEQTYKVLHLAKKMGLTTIFNPAPAQPLPERVYFDLDYLIVNQSECQILTGIYPSTRGACNEPLQILSKRGVGAIVITLGKMGSVCLLEGQIYYVPSYRVENVDTTAAGDTYIGAFASALSRGETISEALDFATRAAAMAITRAGAQPSIPSLEELNYFDAEKEKEL